MHLGQTASFLAEILNRPEPTSIMLSRLLRERGWMTKGPRGRNAPHVSSLELASFLTAYMCCPDSPAVAMDRLPHFFNLPLDSFENPEATFGQSFALLLDRLSQETWDDVFQKNWSVSLFVDASATKIAADPVGKNQHLSEEHVFTGVLNIPNDQPILESLPYHGGLEISTKMDCPTLFRIAKIVLAGEPDPWDYFEDWAENSFEKSGEGK